MTGSAADLGMVDLLSAESPLGRLISMTAHGIVLCDQQGKVTFVNDAALRMTRFNPTGMDLEDAQEAWGRVLGPGESPLSLTDWPLSKALRGESTVDLPVKIEHPKSRFSVLVSAGPIRDRRGKVAGAAAMLVDSALQVGHPSSHLAALVASSQDAIIGKDLSGTILSWNLGAERLYGYSAEEALGKSIRLIIPSERTREYELIMSRIRDGRPVEAFETERINKEGVPLTVSLVVSPVHDVRGQVVGASAVARDITRQKRAEKALRALNSELETRVRQRTSSLNAVNENLRSFTHLVSHDLRAPLRHLQGFSRLLLEKPADLLDPEIRDLVARIGKAAVKAGQMLEAIQRLSEISRASLQVEEVDASLLARSILQEFQERAPERRIELQIQEGVTVHADRDFLTLALRNLLSNSWKFSQQEEVARIEFGVAEVDGEPAYFVRDNGVGFDPSYSEKLFVPFQRLHTRQDFEGDGIGLSVTSRIVTRHGGRIWGESEPGRGAVFYFTLTVPEHPEEGASGEAAQQPGAEGRK